MCVHFAHNGQQPARFAMRGWHSHNPIDMQLKENTTVEITRWHLKWQHKSNFFLPFFSEMQVEEMCPLTCGELDIHIQCYKELVEWLNDQNWWIRQCTPKVNIHFLAMALPKYQYELLNAPKKIPKEAETQILEVTNLLI